MELIVRSNLSGLRYPQRGGIRDWRKIAISLIDLDFWRMESASLC
jgi:hypothetical protein